MHKEFACHHSPVLKAAFNSNFLEGQTQLYTLQDPGETTGRLFVHWLYFQQLDILDHDDWESKDKEDVGLSLVELWTLADKLLAPRLQNQIIQKMYRIMQQDEGCLPIPVLEYVYEHTPSDCALRRFILHHCACYMKPEAYIEAPEKFPKEMLLELAVVYATKLNVEDVEKALGMGTDWAQYQVMEK